MKKIIVTVMVLVIVISLLGCNGTGPRATQQATSAPASAQATAAPSKSISIAPSAAASPTATLSLVPTASPAASATGSAAAGIVYQNAEFGFDFRLPASWKSYTIIKTEWKGDTIDSKGQVQTGTVKGPEILIRHPLWTEKTPRQDIPILIFTLSQWVDMEQDKFHIGAAPVNPTILARNSTYIFALPARYNFSYLTGYEEVDQILKSGALVPTEDIGQTS